jgi:hypothetical protein
MFVRLFKHFGHYEVITDLDWVTPGWLTITLRKNGYLSNGKVVEVKKELWKTTELSNIARIVVSYSGQFLSSLPRQFLLKYSKPKISSKRALLLRQKEIEFYTLVAPAMMYLHTPKCYDGVYCSKSGNSHLLLEDLSDTHIQPKHPLPPSKLQAEQDIDCLASVHAYWWDDPRLGQSVGRWPTEEYLQERVHTLNRKTLSFIDFLGDRLSGQRRKIYEDVLVFLPELQKQQIRNGNLTLIHGDAHCWNFLNPIKPDANGTYLIDWEFWNIDVSTYDIAYMIAIHWYPEMRTSWEMELVKRYYTSLVSNGVQNYKWEDCWLDYRLSVIRHIFTPVLQWANGLNARIWWHNLERIMLAFCDLHCAELVEK